MQYKQSEVADIVLRYFQTHPDKPTPAIEIVRSKYPFAELTDSELKPYVSFMNELIRKDRLAVRVSSGDIFGTKEYYLRDYQLEFWKRNNWRAN